MARSSPVACALLSMVIAALPTHAQDTPASSPAPATGDDLRALRQMVEQQSQLIDALTQQVSRLSLLIESRFDHTPTGAAPSSSGTVPPAPDAASSNAAPASMPPGPSVAEAPRATVAAATPNEAASAVTHVVAKGETLTVIAKRYKVGVADLLKVNKITDERKLQIGQTLTIPTTAKPAETPHP